MECLWLAGRSWCSPWESPPRSRRCPGPAAAARAAAGTGSRSTSGPPPPRTAWGPLCPSSAPCRRARRRPRPAPPCLCWPRGCLSLPMAAAWVGGWMRVPRAGPRSTALGGLSLPWYSNYGGWTNMENIWSRLAGPPKATGSPQQRGSRGGSPTANAPGRSARWAHRRVCQPPRESARRPWPSKSCGPYAL